MTNPIAYLNHWTGDGPAALTVGPQPRAESVPLYTLHTLNLSRYRALLVPSNADQRYLLSAREQLENYLLSGGTVVFNGHVAYSFLQWLTPFVPGEPDGLAGLRIHTSAPHPIFDGVDPEHLTFRRGVAGFYARGTNPPASGAQVLNTLGRHALAVDWLMAFPGGGRLLVHSGNDLWMYAGSADSTGRLLPQLFDWLNGDVA